MQLITGQPQRQRPFSKHNLCAAVLLAVVFSAAAREWGWVAIRGAESSDETSLVLAKTAPRRFPQTTGGQNRRSRNRVSPVDWHSHAGPEGTKIGKMHDLAALSAFYLLRVM